MRKRVAVLALLIVIAVLGVLVASTAFGASSGPCSNNGCKTTETTDTVKQAGNSGGFTQESTTSQQSSFNSGNGNKATTTTGPCLNPGGQPNCPGQ